MFEIGLAAIEKSRLMADKPHRRLNANYGRTEAPAGDVICSLSSATILYNLRLLAQVVSEKNRKQHNL